MTALDVEALAEYAPIVNHGDVSAVAADARLTYRRCVMLASVGVIALTAWHSWLGRRPVVNGRGWTQVSAFVEAAVSPRLDADFVRVVGRAALTSIEYALIGTALAMFIGVVGGVLSADAWWRRPGTNRARSPLGQRLVRASLTVPRAIHEAVWALFLVFVLGRDPLVAVIAIGVPFGAITAKVVADALDVADQSAVNSLRAAGAGRLTSVAYGLWPLVSRDVAAYGVYRLECGLRSSVVLGMIGAGGLGFELAVSFQSLRYNEIWTLVYALIALAWVVDRWGVRQRARMSGATWIGVVGVVAAAAVHLGVTPSTLFDGRTRRLARRLGDEVWPLRLPPGGWSELGRDALATVELSIVAAVVAVALGVPMACVAARRGRTSAHPATVVRRMAGATTRVSALTIRAVPPPVWALLVLFVIYPGPLAGGVALGAYTAGVLARLVADVIELADRRPMDSLVAAGAAPLVARAYGLAPLVGPRVIALSTYRWEVAARETVIVGLVGAGGLGRTLAEQSAAQNESAMLVVVMALVVVSATIEFAGRRIRRAFS